MARLSARIREKYVTREYALRVLLCVVGNIIMGAGVALTKLAAFGNDPFNGSCMAVSALLEMQYTTYTLLYNTALFVLELIFGRRYIGIGTFINWFLLCYAVAFFLPIWEGLLGATPEPLWLRLLILVCGLLLTGLGLSLYQNASTGISPYDSIPLMVTHYFPRVPFFAARVTLDALSTVAIFLCGGIVSLGTLTAAFGIGPIVQLFTRLLYKKRENKPE